MRRSLDLEIVAENVSEAAFLWRLRDGAAVAPHHDAASIAALDERLDAHLEGVRIAENQGLDAAEEALDEDEPGSVFTLLLRALELGDDNKRDAALAVADASPSAARGAIGALAFALGDTSTAAIRALLSPSAGPTRRFVGLSACCALRQDPGASVSDAILDGDLRLRARGLRAAGELGRVDLLREVRAELASDDEDCRFWAAWSATLLDDAAGATALWAIADRPGRHAERAASVAIRKFDVRDARRKIEDAGAVPHLARAAIVAAGALGDPTLVPWLLDRCEDDALARLAAESIASLTGAEIEDALARSAPRRGGPTDDPADDDVSMDPDGNLRWPDVPALRAWWASREGQLKRGARHLRGAPVGADVAQREIAIASQRRRASAAIELALHKPGRPLVEVRARGGLAILPR